MDQLQLYLRLIRIQIRSQVQYRAAFLFDMVSNGIFLGTFFVSIALIFQRFPHIGGWTLGEIALLWGLVEVSFGLMDLIFSGFDDQRFAQLIRQGGLDQLLLRPANLTIQILGSAFVLRRLGRMLEGLMILTVAFNLVEVQWTPIKLLCLPVVIVSMFLFFGGLFIIGATLTFWTVQSIEAVNIFTYGGGEMMSYPMHIYPDWIKRFFTFVIPAVFLNYAPALYVLDKPNPLNLPAFSPLLSPVAGLTVFGVALLFWKVGLRHYQGTGT